MRLNAIVRRTLPTTHEGAPAAPLAPLDQLRRSALACLLWEDEFYESGESIAARITKLVAKIPSDDLPSVGLLAIEARQKQHLRHVPLLLIAALAKRGAPVAHLIPQVVLRADEMAELIAVIAKVNGVPPNAVRPKISAQVKKGLAEAFHAFTEYSLAKYDRDGAVKLRDVLRLVHPKPRDEGEAALWKRVIERTLATPDTWEVELSAKGNNKETWERLIKERKLGYLALLRNLRNMEQAAVNRGTVEHALRSLNGAERVLPFRFVAALRAAPSYANALNTAFLEHVRRTVAPLPGKTVVLVDVSGSMKMALSKRSDLTRMDAAAALAVSVQATTSGVRCFTFSQTLVEVPFFSGLAGIDPIKHSQNHGGTYLAHALTQLEQAVGGRANMDRLVVITDEQTQDALGRAPAPRSYMINVASAQNGIGYGQGWTHIDGFSERVLSFIAEFEARGEITP